MFIDGFSFSQYRSFGSELQKIGPCGKVNLLVGQNNSGKSNVLRFLKNELGRLVNATKERVPEISFEALDRPLGLPSGSAPGEIKFSLGLALDGVNYENTIKRCNDQIDTLPDNYGPVDRKNSVDFIEYLLHSFSLTQGTQCAWFNYVAPKQSNDLFSLSIEIVKMAYQEKPNLENTIWHTARTLFFKKTIGKNIPYEQALGEILSFVGPHHFPLPDVHLIPAVRQVGEMGSKYQDFSGLGIIRRLHELQSPAYNQQHLKVKFQKINDFLKNITGNATAELEIPRDESMIMVHMDGKTLPLDSLGTGIHEMIILAAAATIIESQIVCIEEPEIHLHPLLQRKLVRYLQSETDNQYFLTTHSAHLLDTPGVQTFHVRHQGEVSSVIPVSTSVERAVVCADLGYRASDLVQANSIIWVEGPSDRIYLKHWIKAVAPDLVEGLHYSIMFYGGRLLCHLTADDPEINDFISLRRLNRYISILIDSDKAKPSQSINATKRRIQREFNEGPGFAWVTKGREIENYVDPSTILSAVQAVHEGVDKLAKVDHFDHCLPFLNKKGELKNSVDKIKVAHEVVKRPANLDILNLRKMVGKLVDFINQANDLIG